MQLSKEVAFLNFYIRAKRKSKYTFLISKSRFSKAIFFHSLDLKPITKMNDKQPAKSKRANKKHSKKTTHKRHRRRHFKRHNQPIILLYGKQVLKCYQYSNGSFTYRTTKGGRRQFAVLTFTSKKLR